MKGKDSINAHMGQTTPHHMELIHQLFVKGSHFWMHQLLMDSQANSQNVNLFKINGICKLYRIFLKKIM